ncbi:MAG: BACON domain-containing protein [Clostridia bacterium]|nr:BACON domain-containing protein [Clostridia bacterium]
MRQYNKKRYFKQSAYTLTLGSTSVSAKVGGSTHDMSLSSSYSGWTVSDNASWISVSRTGTSSYKIVAAANTNSSSRTGTVTVTSAGVKKTVTVSQPANSMTVTASSNSFAPGGGTNTITAKPLTGSTSYSTAATWLTVTKSGNTYTVKAAANTTGKVRSGVVAITCGNITKSVTFKQNPYTLTLGSSSASAAAAGSNHTISVSSNYSGWTVSDNASWMSVSKTGSYSFIISVTPNINGTSRSGSVTVEAPGVKKTFTVNQAANSMTVTASSTSFAPGGGTNTITAKPLTGSTSYSTSAAWLTVTKSGNTYTVKAASNTTGKARSGNVTITCGNITKTVTFNQTAHVIKVDLNSIPAAATPLPLH